MRSRHLTFLARRLDGPCGAISVELAIPSRLRILRRSYSTSDVVLLTRQHILGLNQVEHFRYPVIKTDLDILLLRIKTDQEHFRSDEFTEGRLRRMWPAWNEGLKTLKQLVGEYNCSPKHARNPCFQKQARLNVIVSIAQDSKVLLHMGLLTLQSSLGIEENIRNAHSPDNTFLGFVVEKPPRALQRVIQPTSGKPLGLVAGKAAYMWKGLTPYLEILSEFLEIHGNVADGDSSNLPAFVTNHKMAYGYDYLDLLNSVQVLIGLGFPYEGPAPLEAIANGIVFLNMRLKPPHGRGLTPFFAGKPTDREVGDSRAILKPKLSWKLKLEVNAILMDVTPLSFERSSSCSDVIIPLHSQHPYIEEYIGEPYSYTLDRDNPDQIRETMRRLLVNPLVSFLQPNFQKANGYRTFEFTEAGYLERLNALLEHQEFCNTSITCSQSSPDPNQYNARYFDWPPKETGLYWVRAFVGESCATACSKHKLTKKPDHQTEYLKRRNRLVEPGPNGNVWDRLHCAPEHFPTINRDLHLYALCQSEHELEDSRAPYYDPVKKDCVRQKSPLWFDCMKVVMPSNSGSPIERICPCRDSLIGQSAICKACV
ncbi:hypothetical protein T265_04727 [Opisthorchis viverrini]|uniref:alpha-1,6-mannosyl-glycoprotein 6-beta-N-acetylglucosaminyltransferase n=1 Tax=Opisthorchis viverrini TaxID=6198 RepID=A0A074ZM09_OPIVI|nr:hypothetical protein T265_04727 [Opisthorchis viverrini]KER28413.1 hypothetical protein T265_04727 [Opisthorchis viverrini]